MNIKNFFIQILDLIFLTRPVVLIPVWGFTIFGIYSYNNSFFIHLDLSGVMLMGLFSISVASVYILNQIADVKADRENEGFALLVRGDIPLSSAKGLCLFCAFVSIFTPIIINHHKLALLSCMTILLGYFYSCKPFRFSGKPFLDFLSNAAGYGLIAFAAGWYIAGGDIFSLEMLNKALPYILLMCAGSISSTLPDIPGDTEDKKITTAVYLGKKKAHLIAMLFLLITMLLTISGNDLLPFICALCSLPFYILYSIKPTRSLMESTYKAGGTVCMGAAAAAVPAFIVAGFIIFLSTWLYFRKRHGIVYPSLLPVNINE
ncbi:UbiA prenyltransferase [Chitinispirillum alkaliphilum]|nr:UbiA prenyltransferase [Chitinispirillum alkaliphilum]